MHHFCGLNKKFVDFYIDSLDIPHFIVLFVRFHSSLCEVVLLSQRLKEDMQFFHKSSHSSSKLQAHCLSVCLCSALLWQYVVRCKNKDIMGSCVDVWYFSQTTRLHGRKCSQCWIQSIIIQTNICECSILAL